MSVENAGLPLLRIAIVTLFPEELSNALAFGVVGRARERGIVALSFHNPRDFALGNYKRVDERVYGGGPGMVLMLEPLKQTLQQARMALQATAPVAQSAMAENVPVASTQATAAVVYLSPQGRTLTQNHAEALSRRSELILLCGRYEGLDERFVEQYVDEEISIGDYVLSGGEPAALVLVDALTRLLPGALNTAESAVQDSFVDGLLDCPHYTRPESAIEGEVPAILRSGNHAAIAQWRRKQSLQRTWLRRPDLLAKMTLSRGDQKLLAEAIRDWQLENRARI